MKEEDVLEMTSKDTNLYVCDPFEGAAFDHLLKLGCRFGESFLVSVNFVKNFLQWAVFYYRILANRSLVSEIVSISELKTCEKLNVLT